MIVADEQVSLVLTGTGDALEPEAGVMGIGSGGNYAPGRRARHDRQRRSMPKRSCARHMDIAADICVYTNRNITVEKL